MVLQAFAALSEPVHCFLRCDSSLSTGGSEKERSLGEKFCSAVALCAVPSGCSRAEETGTYTIKWCECQESFYAHQAIGGVAGVGFSQRDAQGPPIMSNSQLWDKTWERSVSSCETNRHPCLLQPSLHISDNQENSQNLGKVP